MKYVALGDSTGVGVGAAQGGGYVDRLATRLRASGAEVDLVNLCVSGATTKDVLQSQLAQAIAAGPTLITLGIGINDAGHGGPVEAFAQNFEQIAEKLTATGAPVVITNIPDMSLAPVTKMAGISDTWVKDRIRAFNQVIADIAARRRLLTFDMFTTSRELIPDHPEFFSSDGFHPSAEGYEAWASRMWPTVERAATSSLKRPDKASL